MKNKTAQRNGAGLAVLLLGLIGCIGYRLGTLLPPDIKSVYVPTAINKSDEPFVENEVTRALLERLQLDGSLKIAEQDTADAVLEVTVEKFWLQPISFDRSKGSLAKEYRVILNAGMVLKRRATDEIIVENPSVKGDTTFELAGDLTSGKRIALPSVANDLARDIVEKIVEFW